jgi:hypothetical protein
VLVQHPPPHVGWGGRERNDGIARATCDYLSFIDDDDWYAPGARQIMHQAMLENDLKRPILFRMQYPSGRVIWTEPKLRCGNVGTPMIFIPNDKAMLPNPWGDEHHADFQFVNCFGWEARKILWREEIIAFEGRTCVGGVIKKVRSACVSLRQRASDLKHLALYYQAANASPPVEIVVWTITAAMAWILYAGVMLMPVAMASVWYIVNTRAPMVSQARLQPAIWHPPEYIG